MLTSILISIIVDVDELEGNQQVNIMTTPLDHFMEVHQFGQMPSEITGIVTIFNLDEEIRNMAENLYTFRDSIVFKMCWDKQAKFLANEEMEDNPDEHQVADIRATLQMIHDGIYIDCYNHYKDIYTRLKDGTIRLEEVNQFFKAFKGKYEDLAKDLDIMCRMNKSRDKQWINIRVQQIEQYHELHLAVTSAQVIMKVKETLGLQGDFRVLETLTEVVSSFVYKKLSIEKAILRSTQALSYCI